MLEDGAIKGAGANKPIHVLDQVSTAIRPPKNSMT